MVIYLDHFQQRKRSKNSQIQKHNQGGLDWRAGYLIKFRDGLQLEFVKMNNERIKI